MCGKCLHSKKLYFLAFFLAVFADFFAVAAFLATFFLAAFFLLVAVEALDFLVDVFSFAAFFFDDFFVDLEKALAQPSAYFSLVPTRRIVMVCSCLVFAISLRMEDRRFGFLERLRLSRHESA
jgi:hypothetical protein